MAGCLSACQLLLNGSATVSFTTNRGTQRCGGDPFSRLINPQLHPIRRFCLIKFLFPRLAFVVAHRV